MPVLQAQFVQQRRHFRATHHERLGADIHGNPADVLGAQHPAEPVGRIEQRNAHLVTEGRP